MLEFSLFIELFEEDEAGLDFLKALNPPFITILSLESSVIIMSSAANLLAEWP